MLNFSCEAEIDGDLFNAPERYKVITVNCVGAMGKGIALSCKERYPSLYEDYRKRCRRNEIRIGQVYVYEKESIILLPTKTHFKYPSTVGYVTAGINALATVGGDLSGEIAIPPLGMANGWLKPWDRKKIFLFLHRKLNTENQRYCVYLPTNLLLEANRTLL